MLCISLFFGRPEDIGDDDLVRSEDVGDGDSVGNEDIENGDSVGFEDIEDDNSVEDPNAALVKHISSLPQLHEAVCVMNLFGYLYLLPVNAF